MTIIREKLEYNLLRVSEPMFTRYVSTFIQEESAMPEGLTVPALIKKGLYLYSQYLAGNQAFAPVQPTAEKPRAMLASSTSKTVPPGPTQSNVGAPDPALAVIMATLARMEEQTRKRKGNPGGPEELKSRKGRPHKGRGGGGGRSTTHT